jgi:hypothetical protein
MNAKNRLALYKKRAAESRHPRTWKECRYGTMAGYRKRCAEFTHHEGVIYADSFNLIGDKVADAHELVNLRHTGYWVSHFALIRGAVVCLKTSRGAYYIPATYCTEWDGITLHMKNAEIVPKGSDNDAHTSAKCEAALFSNECARYEAERANEDDKKYRAEEKVRELREELEQTRTGVRDLIREIKAHGAFSPAICATLRRTLRDERERVRDLRAGVQELTAYPWMIHEW